MAKVIWTIGHSNRSADEFVKLLALNDIALIADVRRYPHSKRQAWFNREELKALLQDNNISYRHIEALGGRRAPRTDSVNTGLRSPGFRGYADYMETADFKAALAELMVLASGKTTAVMCAEAVWWHCHRAIVSDALTVRSWEVRHILSAAEPKPHRLFNIAVVDGERIIYPEPKQNQRNDAGS